MAYITAASLIAVYAGYMLFQEKFQVGWLGVFLTTAPFVASVSWWTLSHSKPRTTASLTPYTVIAACGVALALWNSSQAPAQPDALLASGLALAGFIAFLIYLYWYSYFGRQPSPALKIGEALPAVDFEDGKGVRISSSSFLGNPALYLFYRGNWCPLCMAQIKEIAGQYQEFAAREVAIILVSPQPHAHTRRLARKYDEPFHFLVDPGTVAAEALGIAAPGGLPAGLEVLGYATDTVLPTALIVAADGTLIFADQTDNYRVRPKPETLLAVLDNQSTGVATA